MQISLKCQICHTLLTSSKRTGFESPLTMFNHSSPGCHFLIVELIKRIKFTSNADKPPMSDLPYFLDYQSHKLWAPIHNDLPLCPASNRTNLSPSLSFSLMGPKLYVNTSQVVLSNHSLSIIRLCHVILPKYLTHNR